MEDAPELCRGEAASPRPVLSPSNLNTYADQEGRCSDSRPPSQSHSPATTGQGTSAVGRSPRDRMKIDHLLGSPRSPWSPRSLMVRPGFSYSGPQRFTNRIDGSNVKKPRKTNLTDTLQAAENGMVKDPKAVKAEHQTLAHASDKQTEAASRPKQDEPEAIEGGVPSFGEGALPSETCFLPVFLFVAALGDGTLNESTQFKTREILEQVITKVAKEQNTVVNVLNEGPLHIQLRVFAANSVESKTLKEYIAANPNQSPAPFVMLARQLPMAVTYLPGQLDPTLPSVADRLRKQAKSRAIKLLRELIFDASSGITSDVLRGHKGPTYPVHKLESLISQRASVIDTRRASSRYFAFPASDRRTIAGVPSSSDAPSDSPQIAEGSLVHVDKAYLSGDSRPRHFPVTLMIIAIGEGTLNSKTTPKLLHRLNQIMNKVPKEHNIVLDLPDEGSVPVRLRLFVSNSEDAKATREYVMANPSQIPTPLVILSDSLPIAMSYDPRSTDVSDANMVDCLRKQAKSRTVKLLREVLTNPDVAMSVRQIKGHEGATKPAKMLEGPLMQHATIFEEGKRYIPFAARNRQGEGMATSSQSKEHFGGGGGFAGLESLATAAAMNEIKDRPEDYQALESGSSTAAGASSMDRENLRAPASHPQLSQQRICELCNSFNDGSYGTGRFCSKTCRYEAHAVQVAHRRRVPTAASVLENSDTPRDSERAEKGEGCQADATKRELSSREMKRLRLQDASESNAASIVVKVNDDMDVDRGR